MVKMERDGGKKTQRLHRDRSNYALSKLIVDNSLENRCRREKSDSSKFNHFDRSSGTWFRINSVYTDMDVDSNIKVNHIMVSFADHYNAICIYRLPPKTKTGKDSRHFNNFLLCRLEFSSSTKNLTFY